MMSETETARAIEVCWGDTPPCFTQSPAAPEGRCVCVGGERGAPPEAFDRLLARVQHLTQALEEISHLADGQGGRTAQTMMMHGFSPVKALGEAIQLAGNALGSPSRALTPTTPADSTSPTSPGTEGK